MLSSPVKLARGFSLIIVTAMAAMLGLLTMSAFHLVIDHRHRASLAADHALAKQAAELALMEAECELSAATNTPNAESCSHSPSPERIAALNPATRSGFEVGACGDGPARGVCQPLPSQSLWTLAGLLEPVSHGVETDATPSHGLRQAARPARYVIEPIPDAWPGQWLQAGAAPQPSLFRITAAGFGTDPEVSVVLQTVFRAGVSNP